MMSVSYEKQNLQNQITSYLKIQAQDIVKVSNIDIDAELSNYGFDSISNVDLTNQINDYYDLDIMPTIFFELEQPTISALSMHIVTNYYEKIKKFYNNYYKLYMCF